MATFSESNESQLKLISSKTGLLVDGDFQAPIYQLEFSVGTAVYVACYGWDYESQPIVLSLSPMPACELDMLVPELLQLYRIANQRSLN